MKKKVIVTFFATVLAVSLMPLPAFAGEAALSSGSIKASQDGDQLQAQAAKKKTMYVLAKVTKKSSSDSGLTSTTTDTYKYNAKGLLVQDTYKYPNGKSKSVITTKYSYSGTNLKRQVQSSATSKKCDMKFELGKKGEKTQATIEYWGISSDKATEKYAYKAGRLTSYEHALFWKEHARDGSKVDGSWENTNKLSYNKQGFVVKKIEMPAQYWYDGKKNGYGPYKVTYKYSYDKSGNLTKKVRFAYSSKYKNSTTQKSVYKNTYKNGRLSKRVISNSGMSSSSDTLTYTYKKVKVAADNVEKVKAQQWSLLNENVNLAFGDFM